MVLAFAQTEAWIHLIVNETPNLLSPLALSTFVLDDPINRFRIIFIHKGNPVYDGAVVLEIWTDLKAPYQSGPKRIAVCVHTLMQFHLRMARMLPQ